MAKSAATTEKSRSIPTVKLKRVWGWAGVLWFGRSLIRSSGLLDLEKFYNNPHHISNVALGPRFYISGSTKLPEWEGANLPTHQISKFQHQEKVITFATLPTREIFPGGSHPLLAKSPFSKLLILSFGIWTKRLITIEKAVLLSSFRFFKIWYSEKFLTCSQDFLFQTSGTEGVLAQYLRFLVLILGLQELNFGNWENYNFIFRTFQFGLLKLKKSGSLKNVYIR